MALGMFPRAVARVEEQRRRRRPAGERAVVAHIGPTSSCDGLALGQHRHRRVVAVQPPGGQDVGDEARMDRLKGGAAGTHLVCQRGQAQGHALAGVALGLAVERLMLAVLLEQDHRQQAGASPASGDHMEWRRRLGDGLAVAARELLAHSLDDLPLAGHDLQCLGDVLSELRQARAATAGAGRRPGNDHPLARQMFGERLARGALAGEGRDAGGLGHRLLCGEIIFGGRGFQLLELQLELVKQPGAALGTLAEAIAVELLDPQLEVGDQSLVVGDLGPQRGSFRRHRRSMRTRCDEQPLQALGIIGQEIDRRHRVYTRAQTRRLVVNSMRADSIRRTGVCEAKRPQPASSGRHVRCGWRQSIPSSR